MSFPANLHQKLLTRESQGIFRRLKTNAPFIDFCSNDYLGLARSPALRQLITQETEQASDYLLGATGSRLLAGNHELHEELEIQLALFHRAEAALLFNSGYVANLGFFSAVPQRGDTIFYDAASHASIKEGIRLSVAKAYSFQHNSLEDLARKFRHAAGNCYVVVESVYSMDGDQAPLTELATFCAQRGAYLVVDEAHANGLFGENGAGLVVAKNLTERVFARIVTFGKALGSHGAAILGPTRLRDFLINFSRPFIYTTALPLASILAVKCAYRLLPALQAERQHVQSLAHRLTTQFAERTNQPTLMAPGPIHALYADVNQLKNMSTTLQQYGFDVRPVFSPTVPAGQERLRLVVHAYNTLEQVDELVRQLAPYYA